MNRILKLAIRLCDNQNYDAALKIAQLVTNPLRENYDYGEGLYNNTDKFKSVRQYIEHRRKQNKKRRKKKR